MPSLAPKVIQDTATPPPLRLPKETVEDAFTTRVVKVVVAAVAGIVPVLGVAWWLGSYYAEKTFVDQSQTQKIESLELKVEQVEQSLEHGNRTIMRALVELARRQDGLKPKEDFFELQQELLKGQKNP